MNLFRVNLHDVDLSGADLSCANLNGARLTHARLTRTKLRGAEIKEAFLDATDLSHADLIDSDLSCSNFRFSMPILADFAGANLTLADLSHADLTGAKLRGANLRGAILLECTLLDTDFTNAKLALSIVDHTDLSRAVGLGSVQVKGPVTLGPTSLERTARGLASQPTRIGKVEVLLQRAGFARPLLDAFRSMIENPISFYSCFISYSHKDKPFARRLFDRLQGNGIRCWLDEKKMVPGDDIYDAIDRGIRVWDKVILVCSLASLDSWWVRKELDHAFAKERQLEREHGRKKLVIIPVVLDETLWGWKDGRAETVRGRYAADFTEWEKEEAFEKGFEGVLKALRTDGGKEKANSEVKV